MNSVIFEELNFNGTLIQLTQSDGFDMMINATEMWKSVNGNKNNQPYEFLRLPSTIEFINALKSMPEFSRFTLVLTIKGNHSDGTRPGTWMYKLLALEYARKLKPEFAVWCNMKIEELLKNGFTIALDSERQKYNSFISGAQPKIDYYNEVLTYSENLYSTEQICKDLGFTFGAKKLLQKLENLKYIYRRGGSNAWFLSSPYDKEGYTKVISKVVVDKFGNKHVANKKRWTESGKHWIWSLRNKL